MGWLRQMMASASPAFRSYDALAEAALEDPSWPSEYQPQPRSLAAIFSKLDREVELEWLVDRPGVQQTLAKLLGRPVPDFREALGRPSSRESDESRRIRLRDLPFARALDLLEEDLCPGLPPLVLRPREWSRLWWHAPSGAGRSLVGNWLAARGLARFVRGPTWAAAAGRLPEHGPVFVEIENCEPEPVATSLPRVCVAAAFYPRDREGWQILESPSPRTYLEDLIEWVGDRLPSGARFERRRVLQWLEGDVLRESGNIHSLGAALGLLGLVDEWGLEELEGKSLRELARLHFRATLTRAAKNGNEDANWVRRLGFKVLVAIGQSVLTDANESWDEPRDFEAWFELVPEEHQRGADLEWMKLSLSLAKSPLQSADLEKAARQVPPGAYRIVRTLQAVGMLRAYGAEDDLRFEPRWFSHAIELEARAALIQLSSFEWGEALLRPSSAGWVAEGVMARLRRSDFRAVEQVLDLQADESPAQVAALECVFVGVGLALLRGAEVPADQLEALWDEQLRLRVELPEGRVRRRIEYAPGAEPLLDFGVWLLAALAIGEQLPEKRGLRHPLLRPWTLPGPVAGLREIYAAIAGALAALQEEDLFGPALALLDRLRTALGSLEQTGGGAHPLELPGIFLDELEHGVLTFQTWQALAEHELSLRAVECLAKSRGVDSDRVSSAVLGAWQVAGFPEASLLTESAWAPALFRHASPEWLGEWLSAPASFGRARIFELLNDEQWLELEPLFESGVSKDEAAAWASMPFEIAQRILSRSEWVPPEPVITVLAKREVAPLLEALRGRLTRLDRSAFQALLIHIRFAETGAFVRALKDSVDPGSAEPKLLDAIRPWLHARIAERAPEWRDAYAFLSDIERVLAPVR